MNIQDLPWLELDTKALEEIKGGDLTKFNFDFDLNIDTNINITHELEDSYNGCTQTVVFYKGEYYPTPCSLPPEAKKLPPNHPDFYAPNDLAFVIDEALIASMS